MAKHKTWPVKLLEGKQNHQRKMIYKIFERDVIVSRGRKNKKKSLTLEQPNLSGAIFLTWTRTVLIWETERNCSHFLILKVLRKLGMVLYMPAITALRKEDLCWKPAWATKLLTKVISNQGSFWASKFPWKMQGTPKNIIIPILYLWETDEANILGLKGLEWQKCLSNSDSPFPQLFVL
jgi:hypothetical protein